MNTTLNAIRGCAPCASGDAAADIQDAITAARLASVAQHCT